MASSVGLGCPALDPPPLPDVAETGGTTSEPGTTSEGTSPPAATTGESADTTAGVATGTPDTTTDAPRPTTDDPGMTTDPPDMTTSEAGTTTDVPPEDCAACVESKCAGELEQCMADADCACFQECALMNPGFAGAFQCANDCGIPLDQLMSDQTVVGMFVICVQNNCPTCVM